MEDLETPTLDNLLTDIAKLRKAANLLEKIWMEVGPYRRAKPVDEVITDKTWHQVQDLFGFDDSE